MLGAPDWQDGECCFRCRTQFTLVARKHHCRNCGNIFCAKCSSQQIPLPKLNIDKNVRVCDTCYEKITSKSVDPLDLALDSNDKEQSRTKTTASSSSAKSSLSATPSSGNKQNASAPSEQELKEEEELQLALALSLSETPTKVSFPDYRHLEEPVPSSSSTPAAGPVQTNSATVTTTNNATAKQSIISNGISPQRGSIQQAPSSDAPAPSTMKDQYTLDPLPPMQQMTQVIQPPIQPQPDYQIQGRDLEVYKYVGEIQSTLEVFNNRLESCKLRNRPVTNDTAIQSLFLKLNSEYQPKLTEYIKTYEEERAYYERLQDKLSQIADARAALDDLRQEHQEKVRQEAAEAERQRQSQLASKLEAMRQKKSQMMQYQRELALQRIRDQEMMLQQHQQQPQASTATSSQAYQMPSSVPASSHYTVSGQASFDQQQTQPHDPMHSSVAHQQPPTTMPQNWSNHTQQSQYDMGYVPTSQQTQHYQPTQQQSTALQQHQPPTTQTATQPPQPTYVPPPPPPPPQPVIDRAALAQLERQFLPNTKPEEELLISFDD